MTTNAPPDRAAPTEPGTDQIVPYRALVIEDEIHWQEYYRATLEPLGYQVDMAGTFARACGMIKHRAYDVAILDLRLRSPEQPEDNRDGVFLLYWLILTKVPVIIVTAHGVRKLVEEIYKYYDHVYEILDKDDTKALQSLDKRVEEARQLSLPDIEDDPMRRRELEDHFERVIARVVQGAKTPSEAARIKRIAAQQRSVLSTVAWIHISDLHFRKSKTQRATTVLKALLDDIEEQMQEQNLVPDFVAVTGDIAYSGQRDQYDLAEAFFDKLLQATGLTKERLFLVPGNHDVDRSLVSRGARIVGDALEAAETTSEVLASCCDRKPLLRRFREYGKFVRRYFGGHLYFNNRYYFFVRKLKLGEQRIAILGLNSAWTSASDEDEAHGLVVGEEQVRVALDRGAKANVRIALLHHPFRLLREFEQNTVRPLLCRECQFILHGHVHRTNIQLHTDPDVSAMIFAAGASYGGQEYANTYNLVQLDYARGQGKVILRRWSGDGPGHWVADNATYRNVKDGSYEFRL